MEWKKFTEGSASNSWKNNKPRHPVGNQATLESKGFLLSCSQSVLVTYYTAARVYGKSKSDFNHVGQLHKRDVGFHAGCLLRLPKKKSKTSQETCLWINPSTDERFQMEPKCLCDVILAEFRLYSTMGFTDWNGPLSGHQHYDQSLSVCTVMWVPERLWNSLK